MIIRTLTLKYLGTIIFIIWLLIWYIFHIDLFAISYFSNCNPAKFEWKCEADEDATDISAVCNVILNHKNISKLYQSANKAYNSFNILMIILII